MLLSLLPFLSAALLLGAHFVHHHHYPLAVLSLTMPLLLLHRRRWVIRLMQAASILASAEWIATAIRLVHERTTIGQGYAGAVVILGSVAGFTLAAGALLNARSVLKKYPE